jgi:16S rRNA (guanine527-N7)-methyltransferase
MKDLLIKGSKKMGISLSDKQIDDLISYSELLKEWNKKMNLTAIIDDEGIAVKHFLDSMTAICTQKVQGRVIDVGTGAGFPGMVLKIVKPDISLTLLDSLKKRLVFLENVKEKLKENDIELVHSRAEDGGQNRLYREKFDTAVSRAVANMTTLCEWCLPFVKVGGYFLALKGPAADEELNAAKKTISILGGRIEDVFEAEIPFSDLKHRIIIIKKVRQTPMRFPRKPGIATKISVEQCYNLKK